MSSATSKAQNLASLVSPYGLIGHVGTTTPLRGFEELNCAFAVAGSPRHHLQHDLQGTGNAFGNPGLARTVAIAEAVERYAGYESDDERYVWARAADLDGPVLDLQGVPRCSEAEYADSRCPLVPPDAKSVIRWSAGVDLCSGHRVWLPSVMVILDLANRVQAEHIWHSLSTGYAAHTDPRAALCAAICEVIERDIVEILWQQMLPLPRLPVRYLSTTSSRLVDWCSAHFMEAMLFDATSDIGVPCVYCVVAAEHHAYLRHVVGCAAGVSLTVAADKALREAVVLRRSLDNGSAEAKNDPAQFREITDGALYTGAPAQALAFDFLLSGPAHPPQVKHETLPADSGDRLRTLLDKLASRGMHVVAVDRTTEDLRRAGLHAFCVVVPELQPMVVAPFGRFRGHERLYSAPDLMGYRSLPEERLNPWPQPFA